jgi:hypothetical protein
MELGFDSALLNGQSEEGDTSHDSTNSPAPANGSVDGLRFYCHDSLGYETNGAGAVLNSDLLADLRVSMGKFAVIPSECAFIVSPISYLHLIKDATADNVVTAEKYGAGATILTGELARCWGIPVLVSDRMSEAMNATGDVATAGVTTAAICVNRTRWYLGEKRAIELRTVFSPAIDQYGIYGFHRFAFANAPPTTDTHTYYLYNLALS